MTTRGHPRELVLWWLVRQVLEVNVAALMSQLVSEWQIGAAKSTKRRWHSSA